jgi:hypothetical protein
MRFLEIQGGLRVPISNDEQVVLQIIRDHRDPFPKSKLNIREKELARNLVHKGFVDRVLIENKIYFIYNEV